MTCMGVWQKSVAISAFRPADTELQAEDFGLVARWVWRREWTPAISCTIDLSSVVKTLRSTCT
eukprot:332180-Chlamydomonas_euryale.AAC.1